MFWVEIGYIGCGYSTVQYLRNIGQGRHEKENVLPWLPCSLQMIKDIKCITRCSSLASIVPYALEFSTE